MAPVPEDKEKPSQNEDAEIDVFSNPTLAVITEVSDSSDEDEDFNNIPNTAGYTLLSQEPGDEGEEEEDVNVSNDVMDCNHDNLESPPNSVNAAQMLDSLPEEVIRSEAGATAPKSLASTSCHPAFLQNYPDGKVPSYMQVPPIGPDTKDNLWNEKKQDKAILRMDLGQESKILQAMAGFSLPKDHVPEWAKSLSDDQWRQQVLRNIGSDHLNANAAPDTPMTSVVSASSALHSSTAPSGQASNGWVATFPDA